MKTKAKYVFDNTWMSQAPCNGSTDLFYPDFDGNFDTVEEAKAICSECPFQARCLDYALYMNDPEGVYGKTLGKERTKIRKELATSWDTFIESLASDMDAVAEQLVS